MCDEKEGSRMAPLEDVCTPVEGPVVTGFSDKVEGEVLSNSSAPTEPIINIDSSARAYIDR